MSVDRYITAEALDAAWRGATEPVPPSVKSILRAALPGVLAAHRADVLREVAQVCNCLDDTDLLQCLADEAVAE